MKYGFVLPGGTATEQLAQAAIAEKAGWDGVFVWENAYGVDAWTLLGAMAAQTGQVRLGTLLTPLPWRRPWKVASQVVTLDQVSNGRAILTVGLGATDPELGSLGEETDRRVRAEKLDEGIDLMTTLSQGNLCFTGKHYQINLEARTDLPETGLPIQKPRVPIWVVGAWPKPKSMRRVLRCDGIIPMCMDENGYRPTVPDDIRALREWLEAQGGTPPGFDIVTDGETPADDAGAAAALVTPWEEAGCTWWIETRWQFSQHNAKERAQETQKRLEAGPPVSVPNR